MGKRELENYGGNGTGGSPEIGNYKVTTDSAEVQFSELSKAVEYYENLNEEKALWDMRGLELLLCHTWKD